MPWLELVQKPDSPLVFAGRSGLGWYSLDWAEGHAAQATIKLFLLLACHYYFLRDDREGLRDEREGLEEDSRRHHRSWTAAYPGTCFFKFSMKRRLLPWMDSTNVHGGWAGGIALCRWRSGPATAKTASFCRRRHCQRGKRTRLCINCMILMGLPCAGRKEDRRLGANNGARAARASPGANPNVVSAGLPRIIFWSCKKNIRT